MIRLAATVLAVLFPSVPRHLAALTAATQTPGPVVGGEAAAGLGQTPEGEGAPTSTSPRRAVVEQVTPRPPVSDHEVLIAWHASPRDLSDTHLADVVDRWTKEHS